VQPGEAKCVATQTLVNFNRNDASISLQPAGSESIRSLVFLLECVKCTSIRKLYRKVYCGCTSILGVGYSSPTYVLLSHGQYGIIIDGCHTAALNL